MKILTQKQDSAFIVYDADCVDQPDETLFDVVHWRARDAISGEAVGRGSAWFLETEFGPAVLRQYLRGGQAARISRDRYIFLGREASRPFREFRVTATLFSMGLPVPQPLAAVCRRSGLFYTAAIMTRRIREAIPLADLLGKQTPDSALWQGVGATVRRFHTAGLDHADLNARNILVSGQQPYLIDFDRARLNEGGTVNGEANLNRLHRSFAKLWPTGTDNSLDDCWAALQVGYTS